PRHTARRPPVARPRRADQDEPPPRASAPPARKPAPAAAPPQVHVKPKAPPPGEALPASLGELGGHVLAHFRIGSALAKGSSGIVFEAQDLRSNQQVALKVLKPAFAKDARAVQRFIRSMKTVLPLRHPNLV